MSLAATGDSIADAELAMHRLTLAPLQPSGHPSGICGLFLP